MPLSTAEIKQFMKIPQRFPDIEYRLFYRPQHNPLETFYLPTLAASVQYDRSAGYFRSSALAVAASGIARLIQNDGRMRLLVGAELSEQDVEAIKRGYDLREQLTAGMLAQFPEPDDWYLQQRLEALAWMVAHNRLDIKVVLPLDENGFPIAGSDARDYYHTKKGIFTDAAGNRVAFVGSVNESAQAWKHNFEEFYVLRSWTGEDGQRGVAEVQASFNDMWQGKDRHWLAVELPSAVQQQLLKYTPVQAPTIDPLEKQTTNVVRDGADIYGGDGNQRERLIFQFLRDAPFLPTAQGIGAATCAIHPWPHQIKVAQSIISQFPARAMLCDEVGLGKTIEAGLVIRQLLLSGRVKRLLILTPASVLKQWQEELYEKFNLNIPRYTAKQVVDVHGTPVGALTGNPWDEYDVLLASSHLARRKDRMGDLLAAHPWDLLVVDEAHHARRKDFLQPRYRPNSLLTLFNQLKAHNKYKGLLLMTATPMQVHPVEVWDLLSVLGLGGRWGADEENFLRFFRELRKPFKEVQWNFVLDMVRDRLEIDGAIDKKFKEVMRRDLGSAFSDAICRLPYDTPRQREDTLRQLTAKQAQSYVYTLASQHTPLRQFVFRNTRELLRTYVKKGVLKARVPRRKPHICRIEFSTVEAALYQRITEYISQFYQTYEKERRGLGFIMTVYRRRLTSSFYAVRQSLERRRDVLRGLLDPEEMVTPDDEVDVDDIDELEQAQLDELSPKSGKHFSPEQEANRQLELNYLDDFISELRTLSHADSKLTYLKTELDRLFAEFSTVLVFTQYTDTMDYLREHLQTVYGSAVACYSGRGGETWNGVTWVNTEKEKVKADFKAGDVKILLCTESASEGLNLQTCGVLVNYDMPWNPMRVEQRIGRIDRIGQRFDVVQIYNYFYKDSIEDRIYQALAGRIEWFEDVVGSLQPILAEVGTVTRRLAMLSAEQQHQALTGEIKRLRAELESAEGQALNIAEYVETETPEIDETSPVTLKDLETIFTESKLTGHLFHPHPEIPFAYNLQSSGAEIAITFSPELFDQYPDSLQFFSYGNPLFEKMLATVLAPNDTTFGTARFINADTDILDIRGWYDVSADIPQLITSVTQLQKCLSNNNHRSNEVFQQAQNEFSDVTNKLHTQYQRHIETFQTRYQQMVKEKARRLLEKAALVEIALGQQQNLFGSETYPTHFNEQTVSGLVRHKSPWSWLVVIAEKPLPVPNDRDEFWESVKNLSTDKLKTRFSQLTTLGRTLVKDAKAAGMLRGNS